MERRHPQRIIFNLNVELISNGKSYTGFIENLTENGIGVTTTPIESAIDFVPGTIVELKLRLPSEEIIALSCEIIWLHSYKLRSFRIVNTIGTKIIISPSLKYKEFLKTLSIQ